MVRGQPVQHRGRSPLAAAGAASREGFRGGLTSSDRHRVSEQRWEATTARICVFDVNETLLDLAALDGPFERRFGVSDVRREWFAQLLQSALVATATDAYSDFGTVGRAALEMVAARRGVHLTPGHADELLGGIRSLPAHPEVPGALERLRSAGLRLAALTNGTERVATTQLRNAGLADWFERILSADSVHRLKPAREPYQMAARELGVEIGGIRLVAAHAWDVLGALRAGAAAAFVARPGMVLDPLGPRPDIVGADLAEVADRIIEVELGK